MFVACPKLPARIGPRFESTVCGAHATNPITSHPPSSTGANSFESNPSCPHSSTLLTMLST